MATTTNYSWTTPDDTDLVKDGAAAIRTLGSSIDTTVFNNAGAAIAKSTIDAKGDLLVGTADDTVGLLAVGTDGFILQADSVETTGLKWAAPVASSGPAFSVYRNSTQSLTASAWNKIQFEVEDFDTDSCYDNVTNYRFTPNKSGYYQFNYNANIEGGTLTALQLYKNGSAYHYGVLLTGGSGSNETGAASFLVYANGTTDYFEVYANPGTGTSNVNWATDRRSAFSGVWIRS